MRRIRVLAVDDSAFVRKALQRIFQSDPDIELVGLACSGREALEKVRTLKPDVITLDVMMPEMDGIETLRAIMDELPTPVLMLSQLTRDGAELTLKALEMGAMDFVDKSSTGMMDFFDLAKEIIGKVKSIAGGRPLRIATREAELYRGRTKGLVDIVAMGASTGGPMALHMILPKFPHEISFGLLIVQHMPRGFTAPLAKRLDATSSIAVREAEEGDAVEPGTALIAPAGLHMTVRTTGSGYKVRLDIEPMDEIHRPSVNVLFRSVGERAGGRSIGVLLTGMGSDGARGMGVIKEQGGFTIAQDEATSAIYGMPRAAAEGGVVDMVLPLTSIAGEVLKRA
ncbi:MAG: chemotaxis response regulator protein-glutamate methylesterase [Nitrospiraceae bacterium]|nr:chemotaxis response regulator protein-glutamate methylesterase [Nitrospiraceae bacterium]